MKAFVVSFNAIAAAVNFLLYFGGSHWVWNLFVAGVCAGVAMIRVTIP